MLEDMPREKVRVINPPPPIPTVDGNKKDSLLKNSVRPSKSNEVSGRSIGPKL